MRKSYLSVCLMGLMLANGAYAGAMGAAATPHPIKPFVSLEGFPVWISFGGIKLTNNGSTNTADNGNFLSGGARLAGGLAYTFSPTIDFTLETAWSYFGQTSGTVSDKSFGGTLSGADLLAGVVYKYNRTEWFAKAGTLFERTSMDFALPSTFILQSNGINLYTEVHASAVITDILPEIKVGGLYNYTDNIGFSVAYMHAFGQSPHYTGTTTTVGSNMYDYISTNVRGPTLDSVLFGVRYQFV